MRISLQRAAWISLPFLLASYVWADEPADRAAIAQTFTALNRFNPKHDCFAADFDSAFLCFKLLPRIVLKSGPITVAPWQALPITDQELATPRFVAGAIRFVTANVAAVDGTLVADFEGTPRETTPLLILLRKQDGVWRIVSMRVVKLL